MTMETRCSKVIFPNYLKRNRLKISVRIELAKLILVGTRITYQATGYGSLWPPI